MIRRSIRLIQVTIGPFVHAGNLWTRKAARRQELDFWVARDWVRRVQFKVATSLFLRRRSFNRGVTATRVVGSIIRNLFWPVLRAAIAVVLLVWIDSFVLPALLEYLVGIAHTFPLESVAMQMEGILNWIRPITSDPPSESTHEALLATGAQIAGVILGLYFAAISVVAGTAYGNVPPELRAVLIEDSIGNAYLKLVAFTGGVCLFGLGVLALGYTFGAFSTAAIAFLGAALVLSFVALGKRVFQFLDPEEVTKSLLRDIKNALNSVTGKGLLARDSAIQAYNQKIAEQRLDAWDEMVSVSIGRSQSPSALKKIGLNTMSLLIGYSEAKLPIPKDSRWFQSIPKHSSYLLAEGVKLQIALTTGTWLYQEMKPDQMWLEKRAVVIIQRVVAALIEGGSNSSCMGLLNSFNQWIAKSASAFRVRQIEVGFQTVHRIGSAAAKESAEMKEGSDRDRLYRLAVADVIAQAVPHAASELNRRLEKLSIGQMLENSYLATIDESFRLGEFPEKLRSMIESIRDNHLFERDIEGSIRTPSWFIKHHAARALSVDLRMTYESLLQVADQWHPAQVEALREGGAMEHAAQVIQRGLESVVKLELNAKSTARTLERLKRYRNTAAGTEWPEFNPKQWKKRLLKLRQIFIKELVLVAPCLSTDPPLEDMPDSFGWAYTTLCDAAIETLTDMDADTFGLIIPVLVPCALKAHQRVQSELAENSASDVQFFSTDVMLDVFDISGYAYLWNSCLGQDRYWHDVTFAWDDFLQHNIAPESLIILIALGVDLYQQQFASSQRSQIRWQWRVRMRQLLEDRGFVTRRIDIKNLPKCIPIDPIAASFLEHWGFHKARDLMLSEYLLMRPDAESIPVPRSVNELRERARMLDKNRKEGKGEGGPVFTGGI